MNVEQSPRSRPRSGDQFAIAYAEAQVQISQLGATLCHFTVGGWNVIDGFAIDECATDGRGQVLAALSGPTRRPQRLWPETAPSAPGGRQLRTG
jgi:hypothetical protein